MKNLPKFLRKICRIFPKNSTCQIWAFIPYLEIKNVKNMEQKICTPQTRFYPIQNIYTSSKFLLVWEETVERPQWLHYGLHALKVEGLAERAIPPLGYHDPPCRHSVVPIWLAGWVTYCLKQGNRLLKSSLLKHFAFLRITVHVFADILNFTDYD